jgi:hypothetical protein
MSWYQYIECFLAGLFLANSIPHFVQGISGERFPSPFAKPPGQGLSSPTVNVVWGLLNLVIGTVLFRTGRVWSGGVWALATFFVGIAAISVPLSAHFAHKDKE